MRQVRELSIYKISSTNQERRVVKVGCQGDVGCQVVDVGFLQACAVDLGRRTVESLQGPQNSCPLRVKSVVLTRRWRHTERASERLSAPLPLNVSHTPGLHTGAGNHDNSLVKYKSFPEVHSKQAQGS